MAVDFEPFDASWKQDLESHYRVLRDEAPVHWAPASGVWCVSRHEDVSFVLTRPDLFASRRSEGSHGALPLFSAALKPFLIRSCRSAADGATKGSRPWSIS